MEFDEETKALIEQLKQMGLHVMTQEQVDERLARANQTWEKKHLSPIQQELESERQAREDLEGNLETYKRQGKTPEELLDHERQTWETQRQALEQEREAESQRAQQYLDALRAQRLERDLSDMLTDPSTGLPKPANLKAALTMARTELPTLQVTGDSPDELSLSYMDPKTKLNRDPAEALTGWWKEQSYLHDAGPSGPPSTSPRPAPGAGGRKAEGGPLDARAAMDEALAAELPSIITRAQGQQMTPGGGEPGAV